MTTTVYFVRHGETDYNRHGIVQGRGIDSSLNRTGLAQADTLATRLAAVPFDALYTSTQRRARQTAEAVARHHAGVPLQARPELEEMDWGIYEGQPHSPETAAAFEAIYGHWARGIFDVPIDGGESILDVQRRAMSAMDDVLEQHPGDTVLVVSHGRLLRVLLASVLDGYGLLRMHDIKHANTSVNQLCWRGGSVEAVLLNCTAHLAPAEEIR